VIAATGMRRPLCAKRSGRAASGRPPRTPFRTTPASYFTVNERGHFTLYAALHMGSVTMLPLGSIHVG
jgi:hypothetical protein